MSPKVMGMHLSLGIDKYISLQQRMFMVTMKGWTVSSSVAMPFPTSNGNSVS